MREEKSLRLHLWAYDLPEPFQTQFFNIYANGTIDVMERHYSVDELTRRIEAKVVELGIRERKPVRMSEEEWEAIPKRFKE